MSQSIQDRLASRDPAVRRGAIVSLGKSGDERALPLLARVYKDDPDPALRVLALKAGKYLKQQLAAAAEAPARPVDKRYEAYIQAGYDDGTRGAPDYVLPLYDEDDDPTQDGYQVMERQSEDAPLSDENRRKAADLARRGLEDYERGRHADSLNALIAALELNPRLKFESSVQQAAAGLTGQRPEEAALILADPLRRQMYVGQVEEKVVERVKKTGGVSWGDVLFDLALLALAVMLGVVLSLWGANTFFADTLAFSDLPPDTVAGLNALGVPLMLLAGLLTGIVVAITALITSVAVHVVAGFFRGGASLTGTLHALIPIQTVLVVLSIALPFLTLLANSVQISAGLGSLISFAGLIWQVRALSKAHDFGWPSGCASLIITGIVLGLLSAAISFIVTAVLGNTLAAFVPTSGLLLAF
ncbi:MAG: HEAT repeat domain-containing protein [Anaerolineae bacterium]|nr:HEAT repeat domain-containing protein [Anaerolineae bacterium]